MSHDAPLFVTTTPTSQKHPDYKNTLVKSAEGLTSADQQDEATDETTGCKEGHKDWSTVCVSVCVCVCVCSDFRVFVGKFFSRISFLHVLNSDHIVLNGSVFRAAAAPC